MLGKVVFLAESAVNSGVSRCGLGGPSRSLRLRVISVISNIWSDTAALVASPLRRDLRADATAAEPWGYINQPRTILLGAERHRP